ncbi:DUF4344 domain-containing metallopeptidase [Devosia sp. 2618]|uniref:DUF4344 domain-containing metallopeptidase n=1 Tax=Devosia sp. 2618 TaxID=3156454 RepID=UPI0033956F75
MNVARFVFSLALVALAPVSQAFAQEELGPLAGAPDQQLLKGWFGGAQDGWYVLRNDTLEGSEQTLMLDAGAAPPAGRAVSVNVSLKSSVSEAAIGILARSASNDDLCLMEITADAAANLFCIIGGEHKAIAKVAKAARMDGSDVIEMIEVPGSARFLLNGATIGDVTYASALGGELGIMAYERGTFGLADFEIVDLGPAAGGSGLPPKGGAGLPQAEGTGLPPKGGTGSTAPAETASEASGSNTGSRMADIMGPLADAIMAADDKEGWQLAFEGNWLVFINDETPSSENFFTVPSGPLNSGQRITSLEVGILPPQGKKASDFAKSAAGILIESNDRAASCLGEITAGGDGLVLCFGADGKSTEMGRLAGAALGGGDDVLEFVERPGTGEFRLNGKRLAEIPNHPALGGHIGVLAYERGEFYFGGFTISSGAPSAQGSNSGSSSDNTASDGSGPLPMFGHEETRLIGVYLGLANGIFMHEFGHALIGELDVPSTGPEEDAVDIFSALRVVEPTMYPTDDATLNAIGREVAIYSALPWYYGGLISEKTGMQTPWQDEHTGDLKRFRNVFCVIYGGNPGLYGHVAEQVGLDERTLDRCEGEFTRQNRAWRTILAPHTRVGEWHPEGLLPADAPGARIQTIFEPSKSRVGQFIAEAFSEGLTGFGDELAKTYALPRDLKVIYKDCGELNAWYSPREGVITMCYDLIEDLAVMISDVEMGTEGGMDVSATTTSPAQSSAPTGTTATASKGSGKSVGVAATGNASNPIDELAELGVPTTSVLFPAPYRGATPAGHSRAKLVTTGDLAALIGGGKPLLLIDTRGQDEIIPGAYSVVDAGKDGSLTDSFQSVVNSWLEGEASNDKSLPVIFYGEGLQDRSSYNAALRAGALGWNAQWYRGGTEAWRSNGLPLVEQE